MLLRVAEILVMRDGQQLAKNGRSVADKVLDFQSEVSVQQHGGFHEAIALPSTGSPAAFHSG